MRIDSESRPLGAYAVAITYDPSALVVLSVAGGTTSEFSTPPIVNPADFPTGRARLLAFNSSSMISPLGESSVAAILFGAVGASAEVVELDLEVTTLADTNGDPITPEIVGCSIGLGDVPSSRTPTATQQSTPSPASTAATPSGTPTPAWTASPVDTRISSTPPAPYTSTATPGLWRCGGDCDGNGIVTHGELRDAIEIALAGEPIDDCVRLDWSGEGVLTVDELVLAVRESINGCPATPAHSPSPTASPSATVTATSNRPPLVPVLGIYRTFPDRVVQLPIAASDPEGDDLRYRAGSLPSGATLDEMSGIFGWTPNAAQVGPAYVPFVCSDTAEPPASAHGVIALQVDPVDACVVPSCDEASGCQVDLVPIDHQCCLAEPAARVPTALAGCPEGGVVFAGRSTAGFGRLHNCDRLRVINFLQTGASVRFNIETRCLNASKPITVQARLETKMRLVFDFQQIVNLTQQAGPYARRPALLFPVTSPGPFFDLEGAEAQLVVTVTDADGVRVDTRLRLILTFSPLEDLPETVDPLPPGWPE